MQFNFVGKNIINFNYIILVQMNFTEFYCLLPEEGMSTSYDFQVSLFLLYFGKII